MPETVIAIPGFWSHHLKELEELNDYIFVNDRIIHMNNSIQKNLNK